LKPFKVSMVVAPPQARFEAVVRESLEDALRILHDIGFDGVEISILDPPDPAELRGVTGKYGLEVPALSTGLNYIHYGLSLTSPDPARREKAVERLIEIGRLGEALGGAGVIIGLMRGRLSEGVGRDEAYRLLVENTRRVAEGCARYGVDVFFEPLNRYETELVNTVEEGLRLLEDVGADNLYLLLDTFHMNIEEPVIEDSIRAARGRIGHFHVADSNRLAPGMGHLDFASILHALWDTGYRRYLSAEIIVKPDLEAAARTTYNTLLRAMEGLGGPE